MSIFRFLKKILKNCFPFYPAIHYPQRIDGTNKTRYDDLELYLNPPLALKIVDQSQASITAARKLLMSGAVESDAVMKILREEFRYVCD